jgi:hypothetical protein
MDHKPILRFDKIAAGLFSQVVDRALRASRLGPQTIAVATLALGPLVATRV